MEENISNIVEGKNSLGKFWIYSTVFTPHIYFIILTSMIAGNIVEIRLPQIQNRKCLRSNIKMA
jgi:hypothetical protein